MGERAVETAQAGANVCERHHFVWTWPIEGGSGSVGVCGLCGAVTTGERDGIKKAEALREAANAALTMYDPPVTECIEWSEWLRARADHLSAPSGAST